MLSSYERQLLSKRAYGAFIELQTKTNEAVDRKVKSAEIEVFAQVNAQAINCVWQSLKCE